MGSCHTYHIPVLLNETINGLDIKPGKRYIDCTLGGGGHAVKILEKGGIVLGIDQDIEAIEYNRIHRNQWIEGGRLILKKGNFAYLKSIAMETGFNLVSGILLDLGVSSYQLEANHRGFSFNREGKLDMRMDQLEQKITAADLINMGSEKELTRLFQKFGEERFAKRIAAQIVRARRHKNIATTNELARIVLQVKKKSKSDRTHPATRIFQALRIAVNDELDSLQAVLPQVEELLEPWGRLAVISFHSLEDRIVKDFLVNAEQRGTLRRINKKVIKPTQEEVNFNPRARSGKLRMAEKISL